MRTIAQVLVYSIIALVVVIALLPIASAQVHYNNHAKAGAEGYNPFGWKMTGVYSEINFAYDDSSNSFVLSYTKARNWAWKAWWCATCYANILSTTTQMTSHRLYDRAEWEMGSWNGGETGYNEIELETTSTPNYIWTDVFVYRSGVGYQYPSLFDWIPVLIDWIIK